MLSINTVHATKTRTLHTGAAEANRKGQGGTYSSLQQVLDSLRIDSAVVAGVAQSLFQHVRLNAGQRVHRVGQAFDNLYIVHYGFLKTVLVNESDTEQVINFPMKGDLLGVNGIHSGRYGGDVIAMSDCELIILPFNRITALGRVHGELETLIYRAVSRELVRAHGMIHLLVMLSAEGRVAGFLLFLAERFVSIGYSGTAFILRMTRKEIGSYLNLTLETVSRTLSAFKQRGLITIAWRTIVIKDARGLINLSRQPRCICDIYQ